MQFESWNTCIRNTAHQNRTKRLHSIPVDLSMPRAHTSEFDRLRLCQRTATDLSFHLQNPTFLCMLMCLCTQWWRGCTWQNMCAVVCIDVWICVCVLRSKCAHPWLSDFAHYPPLLFLCWKTAGTILSLVFSTSSSFPLSYPYFSFIPPPLLFSHTVYCSLYFSLSLHLSLSHINMHHTSCCDLWSKHQCVFKDGKKLRKN